MINSHSSVRAGARAPSRSAAKILRSKLSICQLAIVKPLQNYQIDCETHLKLPIILNNAHIISNIWTSPTIRL